ncbi:hypothetical protein, partial [Pseudoflavonifractor sp. An187]|uniref:hypothetical protein n=1 Tax=Pseudoflavonifractor sp. An187 TaxID=1965578 RepID=UPI000B5712AC
LRNVKFQNHNENADRHLIASALRWRPFYTPGDFTVTHDSLESVCYNTSVQKQAMTAFAHAVHDCKRTPDEDTAAGEANALMKDATVKS